MQGGTVVHVGSMLTLQPLCQSHTEELHHWYCTGTEVVAHAPPSNFDCRSGPPSKFGPPYTISQLSNCTPLSGPYYPPLTVFGIVLGVRYCVVCRD